LAHIFSCKVFFNLVGIFGSSTKKEYLQGLEKDLAGEHKIIKMLSKGLRDKESTRIDNCLKQLHSLVLPPLNWNLDRKEALELELKDFAMDLESLNDFTPEDLILHLQRLHFDWNQMESFADFLIAFSKGSQFDFSGKALSLIHI
jgi:hypothetical protein